MKYKYTDDYDRFSEQFESYSVEQLEARIHELLKMRYTSKVYNADELTAAIHEKAEKLNSLQRRVNDKDTFLHDYEVEAKVTPNEFWEEVIVRHQHFVENIY